MRYTVPDYYKKFKCLAGDCPATCCAGWQIVIDPRSLNKYRKDKSPFGNRLRNSVDWKEGVFLQYGKRCAFLNEDGLCDMHIEAGTGMMCDTCRRYPRHIEEFENEREITLSVSCPAVAEMLLAKKDQVRFITREDEKEEELEEFDFFLYSALRDTRDLGLEILQNRKYPVHLRMAFLLVLVHDVQNRIGRRELFTVSELIERFRAPRALERLQAKLAEEPERDSDALLLLLDRLEVLDESWEKDVKVWKCCAELQDAPPVPETEAEQLAVYYFYTYFCGAVYDGDAFAKAKMAVVSVLIWEEICRASEAGCGSPASFDRRVRLAYRYSRELEHSDLNLNRMEEMMNTEEQASFHALLGQLMRKNRG